MKIFRVKTTFTIFVMTKKNYSSVVQYLVIPNDITICSDIVQ